MDETEVVLFKFPQCFNLSLSVSGSEVSLLDLSF